MEEIVSTPEVTPAVEPVAAPAPSEAPVPAITAAPDPKDRRAVLAHQFENAKTTERGKHAQYQPRDNGKFAGAPQFPTPPGTTAASTAPAIAPVVVRPEMPKSLPLEMKAHWDAAPVDLLNRIIQRETDYEKGVVPLKEKAKLAEELLNEFKPYEPMMQAEGVTHKAAIGEFMRVSSILRTGSPVQKAQLLAHFMRQFSVNPQDLQQVLSGNVPTQPVHDPQVSHLAQQVQQLTLQQQQQSEARVMAEIQSFANDPEHKHFAAVQEDMTRHLWAINQNPESATKSEREKLKLAYDTAIWANAETRKALLAEQQAKELADRQVQHAKNAAVQVTGAPSAGPAPPINPNDRRALIEAAFNRASR